MADPLHIVDDRIEERIVRVCSRCKKVRFFDKKFECKKVAVCANCRRNGSLRRKIADKVRRR